MRLEDELFYCENLTLSQKDTVDIADFTVICQEGKGLLNYLQNHAVDDEVQGLMRTYMIRMKGNDECAGFFSLKAGLVSQRELLIDGKIQFDTLPGVELANFAVNGNFVHKYRVKGLGGVIFSDFILPIIRKVSTIVGVNLVFLFALPYMELMGTYEEYGFRRLALEAEIMLHRRLKPAYDQSCIFMYMPLNSLNA